VRAGKLHVTAFNTGAVPTAVTSAGFVPLVAPADKDGKYSYEMEILVRADSGIADPKALRGKKVGFVALSSNSGAKAPLVALTEKFELFPGRDYSFGFTGDHERSVRELLAGNYDAVCVANDLIRRAETRPADKNPLDASKYKAIYKSDPFPPLCFGVPHNLPADVRDKVRAALAGFKFEGTSAARFAAQGKVGFAPVNYKTDWEYVRKIDDTLTRLFDRN
jgi:phosphonate transport system substrate-binding protein